MEWKTSGPAGGESCTHGRAQIMDDFDIWTNITHGEVY